jgi:RluA family pseudouridine synthase
MPGDINYRVIFEDPDILVIDKPSGLRTIPDGYQPLLPCLAGQLLKDYGRIYVVHRLDKDTSGVIILAKNADSHRSLNLQFDDRKIIKTYHAICAGILDWKAISANFPLLVNGDRQHRTVIDGKRGKPAETTFSVIRSAGFYHLISAQPHNGYTHIIRAHAAALALPLLSDPLYHHPAVPKDVQMRMDVIPRLALHSWQVQFIHPNSNEFLSFTAVYPPDFAKAGQILNLL